MHRHPLPKFLDYQSLTFINLSQLAEDDGYCRPNHLGSNGLGETDLNYSSSDEMVARYIAMLGPSVLLIKVKKGH